MHLKLLWCGNPGPSSRLVSSWSVCLVYFRLSSTQHSPWHTAVGMSVDYFQLIVCSEWRMWGMR